MNTKQFSTEKTQPKFQLNGASCQNTTNRQATTQESPDEKKAPSRTAARLGKLFFITSNSDDETESPKVIQMK